MKLTETSDPRRRCPDDHDELQPARVRRRPRCRSGRRHHARLSTSRALGDPSARRPPAHRGWRPRTPSSCPPAGTPRRNNRVRLQLPTHRQAGRRPPSPDRGRSPACPPPPPRPPALAGRSSAWLAMTTPTTAHAWTPPSAEPAPTRRLLGQSPRHLHVGHKARRRPWHQEAIDTRLAHGPRARREPSC